MIQNRTILFLLPDCPGYFTELFYKLAETVKNEGFKVVFASTSPFYENFKKVILSKVAKVYYLDEFLKQPIKREAYEHFTINNWSGYASSVRQTYFFGHPLNNIETLKKTKLFFQTIYDEHQVILQISEGVSSSFIYLAHEQGSKNNIPYFGLMGARIPLHFNVHLDIVGNEVLLNTEAPDVYIPTDDVPDYMKNSQFGGLFNSGYSIFSFKFLKDFISFLFLKSSVSLETGDTKKFLLKVYKISFRRIIADFYFSKLLKVFEPTIGFNKDKTYVVYPLHFYPEASTSVFAKHYDGNEFNLIKNIAFSLPENCILVVKEHKSNVGNNNKKFYKKIKQLPNILLLTPYYNLKDNLDNFDAIVTISSTAGFEALTKDVPVYVLGEVFYQNYPGCTKINSYSELEEKLMQLKKRTICSEKNETFNLYSKMCFPGSFNYMNTNCMNEQNIKLLLKPVFDYLRTGKLHTHRNNA
jgi:hypothetical protein